MNARINTIIVAIEEQGYDPTFWQQNEVVLRTPVEQKVAELFEQQQLFGGVNSGKAQINLAFRSLIRTFELCSNVLSLGKAQINLAFRSLIRTFAP